MLSHDQRCFSELCNNNPGSTQTQLHDLYNKYTKRFRRALRHNIVFSTWEQVLCSRRVVYHLVIDRTPNTPLDHYLHNQRHDNDEFSSYCRTLFTIRHLHTTPPQTTPQLSPVQGLAIRNWLAMCLTLKLVQLTTPLQLDEWLCLALRVFVIPTRDQVYRYLQWPTIDKTGDSTIARLVVGGDNRFHVLLTKDKTGRITNLPILFPLGDTMSYYLGLFMLQHEPRRYVFRTNIASKSAFDYIKRLLHHTPHIPTYIKNAHKIRAISLYAYGFKTRFALNTLELAGVYIRHSFNTMYKHYIPHYNEEVWYSPHQTWFCTLDLPSIKWPSLQTLVIKQPSHVSPIYPPIHHHTTSDHVSAGVFQFTMDGACVIVNITQSTTTVYTVGRHRIINTDHWGTTIVNTTDVRTAYIDSQHLTIVDTNMKGWTRVYVPDHAVTVTTTTLRSLPAQLWANIISVEYMLQQHFPTFPTNYEYTTTDEPLVMAFLAACYSRYPLYDTNQSYIVAGLDTSPECTSLSILHHTGQCRIHYWSTDEIKLETIQLSGTIWQTRPIIDLVQHQPHSDWRNLVSSIVSIIQSYDTLLLRNVAIEKCLSRQHNVNTLQRDFTLHVTHAIRSALPSYNILVIPPIHIKQDFARDILGVTISSLPTKDDMYNLFRLRTTYGLLGNNPHPRSDIVDAYAITTYLRNLIRYGPTHPRLYV